MRKHEEGAKKEPWLWREGRDRVMYIDWSIWRRTCLGRKGKMEGPVWADTGMSS